MVFASQFKLAASVAAIAQLAFAANNNTSAINSQIRLAYHGDNGMMVSWNTFHKLGKPTVHFGLSASNLNETASSPARQCDPQSGVPSPPKVSDIILRIRAEAATTPPVFILRRTGNYILTDASPGGSNECWRLQRVIAMWIGIAHLAANMAKSNELEFQNSDSPPQQSGIFAVGHHDGPNAH
ncbi:hypothetical protein PENSUB_12520 [Penicillium subrubescens]|uniref:Uncharacterized protein n=1 Tax=Penicillium subrubescens TaxID=1316194 RepID=A0A1Q5SZL0_9EURO|nr:hypothetical protein PENSUB_12520 [Penicillium subrubescens]